MWGAYGSNAGERCDFYEKAERQDTIMKQILGYMEYDIRNTKQGLGLMAVVVVLMDVLFMVKENGLVGQVYLLFGAVITCSTFFRADIIGSVRFSSLLPGTIMQRIWGRVLGEMLVTLVCIVSGLLLIAASGLFGVGKPMSFVPMTALIGIALIFIAIQNVLLYLCSSALGTQAAGLISMAPGFIMFFGLSTLMTRLEGVDAGEILRFILNNMGLIGIVILTVGILCMLLSVFLSWLILKKRDEL